MNVRGSFEAVDRTAFPTMPSKEHIVHGRERHWHSFVENSYPAQPGFPVQPDSSRWPVIDDRFNSHPDAPQKRCQTPRPNFFTLREDEQAWQGGLLTHLRGGKTFSLPSKLLDRSTPRSTEASPRNILVERTTFPAATDWSWCGGPAKGEAFSMYGPRLAKQGAFARLHTTSTLSRVGGSPRHSP